jgi:tetratricopeptide (TPR) repeat protein
MPPSFLPSLQRREEQLEILIRQLSDESQSDEASKIAGNILDSATDLESVYSLDRDYGRLEELYETVAKSFKELSAKFGDNRRDKRMKNILEASNKKYIIWSNMHRKQKQVQETRELGEQFANSGNYQKALQLLDKAQRRGDEIMDRGQVLSTLYAKASVLIDKGSFEEAIQIYKSLTKMDPSGKAWFYLGYVHGQLGQPRKALMYYQRYLDINPWEAVTLGNIGWTYELLDDFQKASMYYDLSLEVDPSNTDVLLNKAKLLRKLGNDKDAMSYYDAVLKINPDDIDVLTDKIILLDVLKDEKVTIEGEKTIRIINDIIEKNTNDADMLVRKGILLDILHKPMEAIECYDKALKIDPRSDFAFYNKACTTSLKGNKNEAIKLLKRAFELNPSYKDIAKYDKDLINLHNDKRFTALIN